jgi:hypothetical protein
MSHGGACLRRIGVLGHSCTEYTTRGGWAISDLPGLACEPVEARRDKACVVEEQSAP